MKTTTTVPIIAELRAARDKHAARFGYDRKQIFQGIKAEQRAG
mgnify:CR=1 FL=1